MSKSRLAFVPFWTGVALAVAIALSLSSVATAATKFWKNSAGSGTWTNGNNWSNVSAAGAGNDGAPGINDSVIIAPTSGAAPTVDYNATTFLTELFVDFTGAGAAASTLSMPNGNGLTAQRLYVGGWNGPGVTSGRGAINQTTGSVVVSGAGALDFLDVGVGAGSTGTYNLIGGSLQANTNEYIGDLGTGIFNHTGGTNSIFGAGHHLYLGYNSGASGTYTISGGSLTVTEGNIVVGNSGVGTLTIQNQASVSIASTLSINSSSAVNLNGGTLRFNTAFGVDRLNYTAGTIRLAGNRTLDSDDMTTGIFGPLLVPPASITIPTGKGLHVEGNASQIQPNRTVTVNGGSLTSTNYTIGVLLNGGGMLVINNGGTMTTTSNASLGNVSGSSGTATLSGAGSSWNIGGNLTVGSSGAGFLNIQDGSLVYVAGNLALGPNVSNPNAINLQGGTLRFNTVSGFFNSLNLNFTSGTLQLAGNRNINTEPVLVEQFGEAPVLPTGKGLTIEGTATLSKPLTIAGGTFKANALVVVAGGALDFDRGVLELTGGTITGLSSLAVPTNGEFRASGVQSLRITGAAGSTVTATGDLTLGNAAAVNGFGTQGTLQVGANAVTLLDANDVVFDSLALATLGSGTSPGTLNAANGLTLDFGGNITGFGTVTTPNVLAKSLINNGHISGTSAGQRITLGGYVKGVGTFDNVNFTGTFSPGLSPTILSVGNVALSPSSTLVMELGGTTPGSGYDQIQSLGALVFDGTLLLSLINGFSPAAGQSFNLFDWLSTSGTFDTLQLPVLVGLTWNTSQLYTTGVLSLSAAGLAGDYNQNGTVDAADYTVWRNNLGSSTALPNDDTAGVDQDDYTRWKTHFGDPSGSGALANSAVPEPAAWWLATVALLMAISLPRDAIARSLLRAPCHRGVAKNSCCIWPRDVLG